MNTKLTELILVYEKYLDTTKTNFVSQSAALFGLLAIVMIPATELYFRIMNANNAFWFNLAAILIVSLVLIFLKIIPIIKEHEKLSGIIFCLRYINVNETLNKQQKEIVDKMWNEVYRIATWPIKINNAARQRYISKIDKWTFCLCELREKK